MFCKRTTSVIIYVLTPNHKTFNTEHIDKYTDAPLYSVEGVNYVTWKINRSSVQSGFASVVQCRFLWIWMLEIKKKRKKPSLWTFKQLNFPLRSLAFSGFLGKKLTGFSYDAVFTEYLSAVSKYEINISKLFANDMSNRGKCIVK